MGQRNGYCLAQVRQKKQGTRGSGVGFFTKGLNKNKVDPIKRNGFLIHLVKRSPISVENSIRKRFIPPQAWERDLLTLWRERIIFFLFVFWAVFAPFALIPSSCQQIELSGFVANELSALYCSGKLRKSQTGAAFLRKWRAADLRGLSFFVFFQFYMCIIISQLSWAMKDSK